MLRLFFMSFLWSFCLVSSLSLTKTGEKTRVHRKTPPKLILISFDGFRWDYLHVAHRFGFETPNFDALLANGSTVASGGVKNSFPTKTLPNHYTIATGMYPGDHGVVHNNYLDPVDGEFIYDDDHLALGNVSIWWNNGTEDEEGGTSPGQRFVPMPIWIANQFGEKNKEAYNARRSGIMMWPGGGAPLYGEVSYVWTLFNNSVRNESRFDELISWFSDEATPINLGLIYINEPDLHGHQWGPESHDLMKLVSELDALVGYLLQLLVENNLYDDMNLIITSDHGMADIIDHVILEDHLDLSSYVWYGASPVLLIWPHEGFEDAIYANMSKVPQLSVYRKADIPAEYHYTFNSRISPLLFVADPGVSLCQTLANCSQIKGNHGYNNSWSDMHPFFVAHGPAFRQNHTSPQFNNVDIYPMMCKVLGVEPGPNDGNLKNIENILRFERPKNNSYILWVACFSIGLPIIVLALMFTIKACRSHVSGYEPVKRDVLMSGLHDPLLSSDEEI